MRGQGGGGRVVDYLLYNNSLLKSCPTVFKIWIYFASGSIGYGCSLLIGNSTSLTGASLHLPHQAGLYAPQ